MPAIPGTITSRSLCFVRTAASSTRNSSGSRKLKNAALGLRQNMRRSSRYWRHESAATPGEPATSGIGGQLQIDVLERRAGDAERFEPLTARERRRGQLVQERRRIVRLALVEQSAAVAPRHAVARRSLARAE